MFGRSKTTNDQLDDELHPQRDGAKNKPTPKRKDQEAARRQQGVLMGGERGRALIEAADAQMFAQGCRAPEKIVRMWATIPVRPS